MACCWARKVQGVKVIIDMVHHTRLGTIAGTLGIMRMALAQAVHHTAGRRVFQKTLLDQPAMEAVIADLAIEYEAAVVQVMRVARAFDARGRQRAGVRAAGRGAGEILADETLPRLRVRVHGEPWRRRLRGRNADAAAVPGIAAERDLGRLGQCDRAGRAAHAGGASRSARDGVRGGDRAGGHERQCRPAIRRGGRLAPRLEAATAESRMRGGSPRIWRWSYRAHCWCGWAPRRRGRTRFARRGWAAMACGRSLWCAAAGCGQGWQ